MNTTLYRYEKQGLIHRIHKGLYSLKKISDLDPHLIGIKALHGQSYVSCESVLFAEGAINQKPEAATLVGRVSRRFSAAGIMFRSRKLSDRFLYNEAGIEMKNGVRYASLERAAADMLYFNPLKYFDSALSGLVDWGKVINIAEAVGYKIKSEALNKNK